MTTGDQPSPATVGAAAPPLWLVASLAALGPFSVSVYLPAVPMLTTALDATPAEGQLTMTLYLGAFALAQLAYGPLSDRLGRRPMMLAGLIVYALASVAATGATTIEMLLAARFVQALGACAGTVLSRAVVRDCTSGPELVRTLAVIAAVLTLSPALGPALGGGVAVWFGWRACFLLLAALGTLLLVGAMVLLPETNRQPTHGPLNVGTIASGYRALLEDRGFVGFVLIAGFTSAGTFVYNIGAPFVFINLLGMAPDTYGLLGLLTGAGYFGGTLLVRRRAATTRPRTLALKGALWALVGALMLLGFAAIGPLTATSIIAAMVVYAIGLGILFPGTAAGALARYPYAAGAAAAVMGCAQMGFGMAGTALLSAFNPSSALPMAILVALSAVLAASCCRLAMQPGDAEPSATVRSSAAARD
jgi:DHA1 family bicyclomycin/chloramphenicol resistance-like MFS transporter